MQEESKLIYSLIEKATLAVCSRMLEFNSNWVHISRAD